MVQRAPLPPRVRYAIIGVVALVALIVLGLVADGIVVNDLFYGQLGYASVYTKILATKVELFAAVAVIFAVLLGVDIVVAYRLRPPYRPMTAEQQALERYRVAIEPYHKVLLVVVVVFVGLLAGISAAGRWQTWLMWLNGKSFHLKDAEFHRDISYFVFTYPFERTVLGFGFAVVLLALVAALAAHYLFGGIQFQARRDKVTPAARAHLAVLLGIFVLLKAVAYYLDRYGLAFSERGVVTGPSYTDIHAVLPAKAILLVVAVICAGLFFATVWRPGWALPAISLGLLVVSAVVIGGIYPFIVQQFSVKPNELVRERPYIARNIAATRLAYGIGSSAGSASSRVTTQNFSGTATANPTAVRDDVASLDDARLMDPNVLSATFDQLQQLRSYYGFSPALSVDRYSIQGVKTAYVVAVRELNTAGLAPDQRTWVNLHLAYTHGYGLVAAPVNTAASNGNPIFTVGNIPPQSATGGPNPLPVEHNGIYFGLDSPAYSVVDTRQLEINGPASGDVNHYAGTGGVRINGFLRRLVFAVHFEDPNLLLTGAINARSRIMYDRNPLERVEKIAPWLTLGTHPYPAVVNHQIVWIVNGYTTTDNYPYSQRVNLAAVTATSSTAEGLTPSEPSQTISYIRNAVTAVVNAYTGSVTLYAHDPGDPILQTWMAAFPGVVKPYSALLANTQLVAHLRYPEDLFKVQRYMLGSYHVTSPAAFYGKEDFWSVPADPNSATGYPLPAYYQEMQVPGEAGVQFNLTSDMVARGRTNVAAYLAVSSNPADYGVIRVLQLPTNTNVAGPVQVKSVFESTPEISAQFTLLRQGGSTLTAGNLLTVPVGDGLLYIDPIYVAGAGPNAYPTLREVVTVYGDHVGYAPTLAASLADIFGTSAGVAPTTGSTTVRPPSRPPPVSTVAPVLSSRIRSLVAQVQADLSASQAALRADNLGAYAVDQSKLAAAVAALVAATRGSGS